MRQANVVEVKGWMALLAALIHAVLIIASGYAAARVNLLFSIGIVEEGFETPPIVFISDGFPSLEMR